MSTQTPPFWRRLVVPPVADRRAWQPISSPRVQMQGLSKPGSRSSKPRPERFRRLSLPGRRVPPTRLVVFLDPYSNRPGRTPMKPTPLSLKDTLLPHRSHGELRTSPAQYSHEYQDNLLPIQRNTHWGLLRVVALAGLPRSIVTLPQITLIGLIPYPLPDLTRITPTMNLRI